MYQLPTTLERNITLPIAVFLQMWSPDQTPASVEYLLETNSQAHPKSTKSELWGRRPAIRWTSPPGDPVIP